jgi:hypothetical protein
MMMMRPAASVPQPASAASYNFIPGTFGQPYYNQQQVMPNSVSFNKNNNFNWD